MTLWLCSDVPFHLPACRDESFVTSHMGVSLAFVGVNLVAFRADGGTQAPLVAVAVEAEVAAPRKNYRTRRTTN